MEFCPKCGGILLSNCDELQCKCGYTKDLPQMPISHFQKKFNELGKIKKERQLKEEKMYCEAELIIDFSKCKRADCAKCIGACPRQNFRTLPDKFYISFTKGNCAFCGLCERVCPEKCLKIEEKWIEKPKPIELTFDEWYEKNLNSVPDFDKINYFDIPKQIFDFERRNDVDLWSIEFCDGEFRNHGKNGYFTEYFIIEFSSYGSPKSVLDDFDGGHIDLIENNYDEIDGRINHMSFYFSVTYETFFNEVCDVYEYSTMEEKYDEYMPRY